MNVFMLLLLLLSISSIPTSAQVVVEGNPDSPSLFFLTPGANPSGADLASIRLIPWPSPNGAEALDQAAASTRNTTFKSAKLQTTLSNQSLAAHYEAQFKKLGWVRSSGAQSGPVAWNTWILKDELGQSWQGLSFMIEVPTEAEQHIFYVRADRASSASQLSIPIVSRSGSLAPSVIPFLIAPAQAQQLDGPSGRVTANSGYATFNIKTAFDNQALSAHYGEQFEKAGWTRDSTDQSGPILWSNWMLTDKQGQRWKGLSFIMDVPSESDQHVLYVRVDRQMALKPVRSSPRRVREP